MKRLTFLVFLIVITLAFHALALEVPSRPLGRVSDYTDTLSTSQIRGLDSILEQFEQDTTNQIAVVLIPTLAGDNLEDYSIRLVEKWKIGQKGKDNGVILLIVKQHRKIRIEVGYGLEGVLPDSLAGAIIREKIAPHFRAGSFHGGIRHGIFAIISATKGEYRPASTRGGGKTSSPPSDGVIALAFFAIFLINLLGVCYAAIRSGGGYSGGGFGGGGFSGGGGGFGGGGASGGW